MALRCGIVGLPNVGKSTIFNALTTSSVPAENYPFCTIDPHIGVVPLPDPRLAEIARIHNSAKITPTTVEFTDIAGLVRGASKGEGLGNQFLGQIRSVSAIIHVVRCFGDDNVIHVEGSIDPVRDAELIETELLLADLETIGKRIEKNTKAAKVGDKAAKSELVLLERLQEHCNAGNRARTLQVTNDESAVVHSLFLLTCKPILYVANVGEAEFADPGRSDLPQQLFDFAEKEGNAAIRLCGQLEEELALLNDDEHTLFAAEYGLTESGLDKLVQAAFKLLGLLTFFTANQNEAHAWNIPQAATAYDAAGEIHTDFQKGFIKAEVFKYTDLIELGSEKALRDAGLALLEGKDYLVEDGDCILFRFSV